MTAEVRALSPAAEAALATARESGRAQGIEEGRAQWAEYVNGAANAAAQAALAPSEKRFTETVTEMRAHHAQQLSEVRKGAYWRGFAVGGVLLFAVSLGAGYLAWRDAQFVTAAGSAIVQRGGQMAPLPPPFVRCPDGATDPDCALPDTLDRDTGYDRPGRAPRSAP